MSMRIHDRVIADSAVEACLQRMKEGKFRAADVVAAAATCGVPTRDYTAHRLADRLIQRERKAGRIELLSGNLWRCVTEQAGADISVSHKTRA